MNVTTEMLRNLEHHNNIIASSTLRKFSSLEAVSLLVEEGTFSQAGAHRLRERFDL